MQVLGKDDPKSLLDLCVSYIKSIAHEYQKAVNGGATFDNEPECFATPGGYLFVASQCSSGGMIRATHVHSIVTGYTMEISDEKLDAHLAEHGSAKSLFPISKALLGQDMKLKTALAHVLPFDIAEKGEVEKIEMDYQKEFINE